MDKISGNDWIIDLASKRCVDVESGLVFQVDYFNNCLTARITKIPEIYRNLGTTKKREELIKQLKIVQALKKYVIALPSELYKMSQANECQTTKTNEKNNENNNEKNIIKIADENWFVDLASKECFDVQYGLKIKIEYFNNCLTVKIIKMSKDFRNERIPKKEKDILKQFKIVQGLDIYTEALRSSLVENKRKRPKTAPKPPPMPKYMPKLPPIPKSLSTLISKQASNSAQKPTPKNKKK